MLHESKNKYEKECSESVRVKAELTKHEATFQAARFDFNAGRPEVMRLTGELNTVRQTEGNRSSDYKKLEAELRKATLRRDKPLHDYFIKKQDLELELERLVRPFITETLERWENETRAILSQKVNEEIPGEPNEKGTFTLAKGHIIKSNLAAIKTFREIMVENCNRLRDMVHCSIPQIETFIQETEAKMGKVDLTPILLTLDAKGFMEFSANSAPEPGKIETGYVPPIGKPFTVNPKAPQGNPNDQVDPLFKQFDSFKAKL